MNTNGYILYEGPSKLDGVPLVVIATGFKSRSDNTKTGDLIQTWILLKDTHPGVALQIGADESICGDCPHRAKTSGGTGACYVNVGYAPTSIWNAYQRGSYGQYPGNLTTGRNVRLGAYGDPAAVPVKVWRDLVKGAAAHNGYTHQWRRAPYLKDLCMASVDSATEANEAAGKGWRYFRVTDQTEMFTGEFSCPASEEQGKRLECAACMACGGTARNAGAASVVIQAHGSFARSFSI